MCKQMGSDSFENVTYKLFIYNSYLSNTWVKIEFGIK